MGIMKIKIPLYTDWHTYAALFYGVILMIWMSSENTNMILTSLLGLGITIVVGSLSILKRFGGRSVQLRIWFPGLIGLGTLMGAGTTLMTFVLMVFKNGQHGHLVPDFPGTMVVDLLARLPSWTLAGGLLGTATALFIITIAPAHD